MMELSTLLHEIANIIASGPALGAVTDKSIRLMHEALGSEILGAQIVITVPTSPKRPIDVAYVSPTLGVQALPKGWHIEAPDWGNQGA